MRYHQDSCTKHGVFGVCRINCVREICVMVTNILKFPHKNHTKITITQLAFKISPRIFTKLGVWGISQSKRIIQNFCRPTLVTIVTNKKAQLMLSNPRDVKACKNCSKTTCFVSFHRIPFPRISKFRL